MVLVNSDEGRPRMGLASQVKRPEILRRHFREVRLGLGKGCGGEENKQTYIQIDRHYSAGDLKA